MTKESIHLCTTSSPRLSNEHVGSFVAHLDACGYAASKLPDRRRIAQKFVEWTQAEQIAAIEINEFYVLQHLELTGQPSKERLAFKRALLRNFLRHLQKEGVLPKAQESRANTPAKRIEQNYVDYLRNERGLTSKTVLVYLPFIRPFIGEHLLKSGDSSTGDLKASVVRMFILDRIKNRSSKYARLQAIALRSFLHFLFLRGLTHMDLSQAITPVRKEWGATVHVYLTPVEIERVLSTPDCRISDYPTG